ncbi:unnamed protein product [Choristocarpus tenellus]
MRSHWLAQCSVGMLMCSYAILVSLRRTPEGSLPFDVTALPLARDCLLFVVTSALRAVGRRWDTKDALGKPGNCLPIALAAFIFLMASTVDLGSLLYLSPTTYQVLRHARIVLVAPLFVAHSSKPSLWGASLLFAGCSCIVLGQILDHQTGELWGTLAMVLGSVLSALAPWARHLRDARSSSPHLTVGWGRFRACPSMYAWSVALGVVARVMTNGLSGLADLAAGCNVPEIMAVCTLAMTELVLSQSSMQMERVQGLVLSSGLAMVLSLVLAGGLTLEDTTPWLFLASACTAVGIFLLLKERVDYLQGVSGPHSSSLMQNVGQNTTSELPTVAVAWSGIAFSLVGLMWIVADCFSPSAVTDFAPIVHHGLASDQQVQRCVQLKETSVMRSWAAVAHEDQDWWFNSQCEGLLQEREQRTLRRPKGGSRKPCGRKRRENNGEKQIFARELKGRYSNKTCVLVANGPSLNAMRWDWQDSFDGPIMGMNKVFLALQRYGLRLDLYAVVNELVIAQSLGQIWDLLPVSTVKWVSEKKRVNFPCHGLRERNMMYFKPLGSKESPLFSEKVAKEINTGWTVTYVSLQVLYYVGCTTVVIVGMDHHFEQTGASGESQVMHGRDPNHFDPTYFANETWQLAGLQQSEHSYRIARKVFEDSGRSIIDATVGGHCKVFEKGDYLELLYNKVGATPS